MTSKDDGEWPLASPASAILIEPEELQLATGKGVRVLVLDSGVERTHPHLASLAIEAWDVQEVKRAGMLLEHRIVPIDGGDTFGHGTAVAGIIHDHAPESTIHSLRVLTGKNASAERVLAGLRWAVDEGYDIVNCSFGTHKTRFVASFKREVDRAFSRGVLLVSACDNRGYQYTNLPSTFPAVISTDLGAQPSPLALGRRAGELVEFIAHGTAIRVAWLRGSYRTITGTSFAAPHLAALVARIHQLRPDWNVCQVKSQLYRLARPRAGERASTSPGSAG